MQNNQIEAISTSTESDKNGVFELYKTTAKVRGGLARISEEVTEEYVKNFLMTSLSCGLTLVTKVEGKVVAELHAYKLGLEVFDHILSELTMCVHPDYQGMGIGKRLFERFMFLVKGGMPEITRVELITRETNHRAIALYQSIGFEIEGYMKGRIVGVSGELECDVPMAWIRD